MKMGKYVLVLISIVITGSLLLGGSAYAQEEPELPRPGITPDSPFYFLDNMNKSLGMLLAFGPEAKAKKAVQYAGERLAEARAMAAKNKGAALERAARGYDKYLAMAAQKAEDAAQRGAAGNASEIVAQATARHLAVLDRVRDAAPEQAREALGRARESSMNGMERALRALAKEAPDMASQINMEVVEGRLIRARARAAASDSAETGAAIDDTMRSLRFGEEISSIARGQGKDTTAVEQRVAMATSAHLEALAEVYQKVPEQARAAIEAAMAKSMENRDRAVEALKTRGALDEVPEEPEMPESMPAGVRERLRARGHQGQA